MQSDTVYSSAVCSPSVVKTLLVIQCAVAPAIANPPIVGLELTSCSLYVSYRGVCTTVTPRMGGHIRTIHHAKTERRGNSSRSPTYLAFYGTFVPNKRALQVVAAKFEAHPDFQNYVACVVRIRRLGRSRSPRQSLESLPAFPPQLPPPPPFERIDSTYAQASWILLVFQDRLRLRTAQHRVMTGHYSIVCYSSLLATATTVTIVLLSLQLRTLTSRSR